VNQSPAGYTFLGMKKDASQILELDSEMPPIHDLDSEIASRCRGHDFEIAYIDAGASRFQNLKLRFVARSKFQENLVVFDM